MTLKAPEAFLVLESSSPPVPPARPEAKDYPMQATSVVLSLGVWFRRRALRQRPAPAGALIFSIRAVPAGLFCCCSNHEPFANPDRHTPRRLHCASVSAGQISRADRRGRVRSEKRCSRAMYMTVACSAARRRVVLGLRRARIKLLVAV